MPSKACSYKQRLLAPPWPQHHCSAAAAVSARWCCHSSGWVLAPLLLPSWYVRRSAGLHQRAHASARMPRHSVQTTCDPAGGTAWAWQPSIDGSKDSPLPKTFQPGHVTAGAKYARQPRAAGRPAAAGSSRSLPGCAAINALAESMVCTLCTQKPHATPSHAACAPPPAELFASLRSTVRRAPDEQHSGEEDAGLCSGWAAAAQAAQEGFLDAAAVEPDSCPATLGSIEFLRDDPYQGALLVGGRAGGTMLACTAREPTRLQRPEPGAPAKKDSGHSVSAALHSRWRQASCRYRACSPAAAHGTPHPNPRRRGAERPLPAAGPQVLAALGQVGAQDVPQLQRRAGRAVLQPAADRPRRQLVVAMKQALGERCFPQLMAAGPSFDPQNLPCLST